MAINTGGPVILLRPITRRGTVWLPALATILACCLLIPSAASAANGVASETGVSTDWWGRVQEGLRESEYRITWQAETRLLDLEAAYHAPNRAHNFRTYFTETGIRVVPRTEPDASWEWGLSLVSYGRGDVVAPIERAALIVAGDRIDYRRGEVGEWYVNGPRGLKQGFTLPLAPEEMSGASHSTDAGHRVRGRPGEVNVQKSDRRTPVSLLLALGGTLSPVISTDGQAIDFRTPRGGYVVHYAELDVRDGRGKELPAWMEGYVGVGIRGILVVIDDTGAVYPINVDPLATSPAWTAESNQADAQLGFSVSTAGDVNGDGNSDVIVGAFFYDNGQTDEGRAFVYLGSASGLSTGPAWTAEGGQVSDRFGKSVSTAGDVNADGYGDVIVGAEAYNNGQAAEGRAYVYHGSASGLAAAAAWTAESDQALAFFGSSVATSGDVDGDGYSDVIVGAYNYGSGGRAFVYLGSAAGLASSPAWTAESDQGGVHFGESVAAAGDVNGDGYSDVIVGAFFYDNGQTDEGRAYVYHGSASGLAAAAAWTTESDQAGAFFGWSVATAGDVNGDGYSDVVVGAIDYENGQSDEGRAFVYLGSASGLAASAAWTAESDQAGASFGYAVSTAGDVNGDGYSDVIVGDIWYDSAQQDVGRAVIYLGSGLGLEASPVWEAVSDQSRAEFGSAVATAGDVNGDGFADVIVGARYYDNGETDEGRALVYLGSAAGLSTSAGWTAESNQADAYFGPSLSTAGDVNGDGYADVIVGASLYDNGQTDEGRAYVFHGSASGLSMSPAWTAENDQAGARFGVSVATAGDVNGDGYSDVIVGALHYDNSQTDEGSAYLYLGSASGLSMSPAWTAEGDQAGANFGVSVSTAGDVNGDGYADVIVGAQSYDNSQTDEGSAYLYLGSASGLSMSPAWTAEGDQAGANSGVSVSTAGDVNGDGYADVIVGAYLYDNGQTDEGRAVVYPGSASGLSSTAVWTMESDQAGARSYYVATAGDVNGDGYADVIVGAPWYDHDQFDEGRAFVYHGSPSGLSTTAAWTAEGDQVSASFGYAVSTAGDVNGDGYADVIVGAPWYDHDQTDEGRAFVYHGSASGLSSNAGWTAESDQAGGPRFGYPVATAGDVNGDGYSDVIVGAMFYDNGQTDEGRAFLYYGNGGAGLSVNPQQRRADDTGLIAQGGRSRTPGELRLASLGRTPLGRGQVKLEWEVKRSPNIFDGIGTHRTASWQDTGVAGASLSELVTGLEPGSYHWRVRLLYNPVNSPFQQKSRWFTVPWSGWNETDLSLGSFIGGAVWKDADGDGIRESGEAAMVHLSVHLLDAGGTVVRTTFTDSSGNYGFEVTPVDSYRVRFTVPSGYLMTLQDQGVDDSVDSDAHTVSYETALIYPPYQAIDATGWSAGMLQEGPCLAPDEPLFIYGVRSIGPDTILDFQDPNQPSQLTGYNVYRSSDAGLPHDQWPMLGSNVVDMDAATANKQWVDHTGDVSPTEIWFYQVTAYNAACDAEGPW